MRTFSFYRIFLAISIFIFSFSLGCNSWYRDNNGPDGAWWKDRLSYNTERNHNYKESSHYVTMRDGVKIAVQVYLPGDLKSFQQVPAIIHQTRYFRAVNFKSNLEYFLGQPEQESIERFTAAGYAYVMVDVRGTGASSGTRPCPWSKDEIEDGAEVVEWMVHQTWSNGIVGSTGGSYAAGTAEFLVTNCHPAVKAVVLRWAMYDAYTDVARPGGIHLDWFTRTWGHVNHGLDSNDLGQVVGIAGKIGTRGIKPVTGDRDRAMLRKAVAGHAENYNPNDMVKKIVYRDEKSDEGISMADISPFYYQKEMKQAGIPIYSYSGWFDGGYTHAAVKRFLTVKNPGSRLMLGPWPHDGMDYLTPFTPTQKAKFDLVGETMRFFDHYLKGIDNGIDKEPLVHYYTMGEEKWKTAQAWPPPGAETKVFYFGAGKSLTEKKPEAKAGSDSYLVDYEATTGTTTRWVSLVNLKGAKIGYPDRTEQDKRLFCYDSAPLASDTEVTGHPIVTLYVDSSADDGQFFVYLEEVDPDGHVYYVTEGQLRAIHRKLSHETPPYKTPTPYRTFLKKDAELLVPGQVSELKFDLQPISYQFKKGNRIRIALAGADKDNFELPQIPPPTVRYHRSRDYPSHIDLPVMD